MMELYDNSSLTEILLPAYHKDFACWLPYYGSGRCTLLRSSLLRQHDKNHHHNNSTSNSSPSEIDANSIVRGDIARNSVILIQRPKKTLSKQHQQKERPITFKEDEKEEEEEVVLCKMSTALQNFTGDDDDDDNNRWLLYYDDSTTYPLPTKTSATTAAVSSVQLGEGCQSLRLPCTRVTSCARNPTQRSSASSCNMYPVYCYPQCVVLPLLSIILIERRPNSNTDSYSAKDTITAATANLPPSIDLLHSSCIKRCLIGRLVILDCITSVSITSNRKNIRKYYYKVLQVTPKQQYLAPKHTSSCHRKQVFQILPSTIITISTMHTTTSDNLHHQYKEKKQQEQQQLHQAAIKLTPHELSFSNRSNKITTSTTNKLELHPLPLSSSTSQFVSYNPQSILFQYVMALHKAIAINSNSSNHNNLQDQQVVDVPRSFLLTGPQGVGKTFSVQTTLEQFRSIHPWCHLISIRGSECQNNLPTYFQQAASIAGQTTQSISILFLDEFDALMSDMITVAQLGYLLDCVSTPDTHTSSLAPLQKEYPLSTPHLLGSTTTTVAWNRVIVVAATNRAEAIPDWLRRRLVREINVTPPNGNERSKILLRLLSQVCGVHINLDDLNRFAEECVGYVAADLAALVRTAVLLASSCSSTDDNNEGGQIAYHHLLLAKEQVGASALRGSAITTPSSTSWDDIAGNAGGAKEALRRAVEWPRTKTDAFRQLGLSSPRGVLLYGPPGCAKTSLARAAAGSAGIAFISLSPAEVFASSYVGDAEGIIRRAFSLARSVAPCILFFDEIDAILGTAAGSSNTNHGMGRESSSEARVMSTFLNEMDGVDSSALDGVICLGATNRPAVLDAALLRPGRFDRVIYVPPPDLAARRSLFSLQLARVKCCKETIDVDYLASDNVSGRLTGAEIVGACQEALMLAMREVLENAIEHENGITCYPEPILTKRHLDQTLRGLKPLLTESMLVEYKMFEEKNL